MRTRSLLAFVAAVGLTTACDDANEPDFTYRATLTGSAEVPPNASTATGTFTGTINPSTNIMTYQLSWSGLGSNTLMAHIHGPAAVGAIANILVDFDAAASGRILALGSTSGTGSGTINLSTTSVITATVSGDSLRKLFDAGQAYVNVHSTTLTGGEIRGQITRQ